ncbi:MAG TPA: alpha-1,4-glucan--maltose-1-phosphate maltosyltransferase [Streptosporangiaceae bacterium]
MIGRIPIVGVQPVVAHGQRSARAVVGESFEVSATVFREGHEMLGAGVVLRGPDGRRRPLVPMQEIGTGLDRYGAEVTVTSEGLWHFEVEAWGDPIARWRHDAAIKVPIGQDTELTLTEGALLFERAASAVRTPRPAGIAEKKEAATARAALEALAATLRLATVPPLDRLAAAFTEDVTGILRAFPLRLLVTKSASYPVMVHRERALYGSWYEFFPRSEGAVVDPAPGQFPKSGTLRSAQRRLDAIARMGFDVVYLPPVHPIGTTARKGPNNSLTARPGDPGSPWAIGSPEGGHDAVHPGLGTLADFDAFVRRAGELGLEVALDLALQASPDHPWVTEHPEWFTRRADGTVAYAENPPKKYQDIYPINFDNDPEGIYAEVLRIVRHWMAHGIRIFRVDNPHTKPLSFWDRLLAEIARTDPDVLFLAEAFTRPAMMHNLAIIGFHQSYTYFTWRNSAQELTEYLRELSGPAAAYMRPNFFVNTPDILTEYLQHGGPPAFRVRAALAATLSPTWGVYSGYELCENVAVVPGSEEYLDSEKYQYRPRDWEHADSVAPPYADISPFIARLNLLRKAHPALHRLRNLRFHYSDQPEILCFSKSTGSGGWRGESDTVLVVINIDPHQPREATVWLDEAALGVSPGEHFTVTDELSGESYRWSQANYVRLDPAAAPAHIFTVSADHRTTDAHHT